MMQAPTTRAALEAMAASSAGQYNLGLSKLDRVEIPLPGLDQQDRLLAYAKAVADVGDVSSSEIARSKRQSSLLRASLLAAAFSGRLTGERTSTVDLERVLARV